MTAMNQALIVRSPRDETGHVGPLTTAGCGGKILLLSADDQAERVTGRIQQHPPPVAARLVVRPARAEPQRQFLSPRSVVGRNNDSRR